MVKSIYLDYAASAEPNPSSIHGAGVAAKNKLENARRAVAEVLGSRPEEVIFTSGGTEGNNLAILGVVHAAQKQNFLPHIVTTNIEHPSVLETCRLLEQRGLASVSIVPVEANGIVHPKKIKKEINKQTVLVSVMYANNEIGTLQPLREIAREIRHYRKQNRTDYPYFHTDAVQAVNYLELRTEKLGVDMLTLSGSKIPKAGRVGVLYRKKSVPLQNIFGGGDQEMGLRPGTENLPGIVKFSAALQATEKIKVKEVKRLNALKSYFFKKIKKFNCIVNGDPANSLPSILSVTFPGIPSDLLVIELGTKGIMASSKSACKSASDESSYVIKALRGDADPDIGALRFSLGRDTTKSDIDQTLRVIAQILTKLKKWYT